MPRKRRRYEGFGRRIGDRITALGYKNPRAFALAKGYDPSYLYLWINESKQPGPDNLARLAVDLEVTQGAILFGDESPRTATRARTARG